MTPTEPVTPPTREDPTVPPSVTIKQSTVTQDGINVALFTVMESGNAYAVENSYDLACQSARSIFGEDVPIDQTPAAPVEPAAPAPAAAPEPPPVPTTPA